MPQLCQSNAFIPAEFVEFAATLSDIGCVLATSFRAVNPVNCHDDEMTIPEQLYASLAGFLLS